MSTQTDVRVAVRVDKNLKESAEFLFDRLGMNMSVAINVFLRKAVEEQAIPFPVELKTSRFAGERSPGDITLAFIGAVAEETALQKSRGLPVARYDAAKGVAYLEMSDGSRVYVEKSNSSQGSQEYAGDAQ